MNALGELIHKFFENLAALWPIVVVDQWERAVRVRFGKIRDELYPGVHFAWPFVDVIWRQEGNAELFSAGRQTVDGQTVEVIGVYRLVDISKFCLEINDDMNHTVGIAVAAATSRVLSENKAAGATDVALRKILHFARRRVKPWGLKIEWLEFYMVTEDPSLRLISDKGPAPILDLG